MFVVRLGPIVFSVDLRIVQETHVQSINRCNFLTSL
jgi:hypothetical protein